MWRRWISGLAVLGMLLHAAVVVRHHQMMATPQSAITTLAAQAAAVGSPILVVDGMVICQSGHNGSDKGGQTGHKPPCPLCNIATQTAALGCVDWVAPSLPPTARTGQTAWCDQRQDVVRRLRPPSRAPPVEIV